MTTFSAKMPQVTKTTTEWAADETVIDEGIICVETNDAGTAIVGAKIGLGSGDFASLDYFVEVGSGGAVDSVNAQTGVVVLDADDIDDSATTHRFATAAQLSKLDGVEAGATADQSAAEILTAIKTVDGTGSGLDADTVDGQEASAFATAAQGALADSATQPGDDADTLGSGAATDGQVLTADGAGGAAWEDASGTSADTLANRPAAGAGNSGDLFFATDVDGGTLYRSNGSSWVQVAASVTGPSWVNQNTQTGTSYTLVLTDAGKVVEMDNASPNTLTVPPNSSVAFPTGTVIGVYAKGAGATTVAAGSGVTVRNAGALSGQYVEASLRKRATDEWVLTGSLA